jgi:hypothetical protein
MACPYCVDHDPSATGDRAVAATTRIMAARRFVNNIGARIS